MADRKKQRWMCGVKAVEERPGWWTWELDGRWWSYDAGRGTLAVRRAEMWSVVGTFECIKLAVGFTVGLHDGIGLAHRTQAVQLIA